MHAVTTQRPHTHLTSPLENIHSPIVEMMYTHQSCRNEGELSSLTCAASCTPATTRAESALLSADYDFFLMILWSEIPEEEKTDLLKRGLSQGHLICAYELALSEFIINPTEETLIRKSLPLIDEGNLRLLFDLQCYPSDTSTQIVRIRLNNCYRQALIQTALSKGIDLEYLMEWKKEDINAASNEKCRSFLEQVISGEILLASAQWLFPDYPILTYSDSPKAKARFASDLQSKLEFASY
ncbi:MAG: hypothetical protein K9M07_01310 [Simkaniaceae bacterium]|nr:hypothetical protein [Simkaniaceae bacterium]